MLFGTLEQITETPFMGKFTMFLRILSASLFYPEKEIFLDLRPHFSKMFFGKTYCKAIEYKAKLFLISVIVFDSLSMWKVERRKDVQKQPPIGAPRKRCSKNMQQIYRKTPMPRCNFNKVLKQFYWNHTPA